MERVTIFTADNVVRSSTLNDVDVLPDVELVRLTGEQEKAMIEQLVKPIQFRYVLIAAEHPVRNALRSPNFYCTYVR